MSSKRHVARFDRHELAQMRVAVGYSRWWRSNLKAQQLRMRAAIPPRTVSIASAPNAHGVPVLFWSPIGKAKLYHWRGGTCVHHAASGAPTTAMNRSLYVHVCVCGADFFAAAIKYNKWLQLSLMSNSGRCACAANNNHCWVIVKRCCYCHWNSKCSNNKRNRKVQKSLGRTNRSAADKAKRLSK